MGSWETEKNVITKCTVYILQYNCEDMKPVNTGTVLIYISPYNM